MALLGSPLVTAPSLSVGAFGAFGLIVAFFTCVPTLVKVEEILASHWNTGI
jgi:hypothetical protein